VALIAGQRRASPLGIPSWAGVPARAAACVPGGAIRGPLAALLLRQPSAPRGDLPSRGLRAVPHQRGWVADVAVTAAPVDGGRASGYCAGLGQLSKGATVAK